MDLLLLKIVLIAVCTIQGAQSRGSWYKAMKWCYHEGGELHVGDFNGDGRADMLCHDSAGQKWVALANSAGEFTGNSWYKAMKWCYHAGSKLEVGDFNGDGRTDMLCHDSKGSAWVALANSAGKFTGNSWYKAMKWCYHAGSKLEVGDFNGDGRDDMLCHDGSYMWISLGNTDGSFTVNSWQKAITWCNEGNGAAVYVGDFNNDNRDDLLCHDNAGKNSVMLAQSGGSFTGSKDWSSSTPWCAGEDFHVGDMNGDNRADMVCNFKTSGKTTISFANANVHDLFKGSTDGRTRHCSGKRILYLADFNGDHEDDMLCHDTATGEKWIDYSSFGAASGPTSPPPPPPARPSTNPPPPPPTEAALEKLGCFKDKKSDRALEELIANFRESYDKNRAMETAIEPCAEEAKKNGYHYFGVQYHGECWSAPDSKASKRYKKYGSSKTCANGVGGSLTNMVYKINT